MKLLKGEYRGGSPVALWGAGIGLAALALLLPFVFVSLEGGDAPKYFPGDTGILVQDLMHERRIAYTALALSTASIRTLGPGGIGRLTRTGGTRALDSCSGWFRLSTGEPAYASIADCRDGAQVLQIGERTGGVVLLGSKEPARLLEELRRRASAAKPAESAPGDAADGPGNR